jgi:SAM-dependent methyltransferase
MTSMRRERLHVRDMGNSYNRSFAKAYDARWNWFAESIAPEIGQYACRSFGGKKQLRVLDLGCGTGALAVHFGKLGHRVTGLDLSPAMLRLARERRARARLEKRITLRLGDMRGFKVGGKFDVVTATFDTLNHVDAVGVESALRCATMASARGALLACDLVTRHGLRRWNTLIVDERSDMFICNRGIHAVDSRTASIMITGFIDIGDGRYERFSECHVTTAFELRWIASLLRREGWSRIMFSKLGALGESLKSPEAEERVVLLAHRR